MVILGGRTTTETVSKSANETTTARGIETGIETVIESESEKESETTTTVATMEAEAMARVVLPRRTVETTDPAATTPGPRITAMGSVVVDTWGNLLDGVISSRSPVEEAAACQGEEGTAAAG